MAEKVSIMAIDDNLESQNYIEGILTKAGYETSLVDSCERALAAAALRPPDLILVAVKMIDKGGMEACRDFKADEKTKNVPIIVISEFSEQKEWTTSLQVGAADYITKPFPAKELLVRISTHLALVRARSQLEERTASLQSSLTDLLAEMEERHKLEEELRKNLDHAERSRRAMLSMLEDQKRAEFALRESERKLRLVTDNIQDMIWLMDLDQKSTWISPSVIKVRGFSEEEFATLRPEQSLTGQSLARVNELMSQLTPELLADPEAKISVDTELEVYRKDGTTIWTENIVSLLRDEAGRPMGFLGVGRDITSRRLAEQAKDASEEQYRRLFEAAKDGILILGADNGEIVDVNPFMIDLLGQSKERLIGKHLWDIGLFRDTQAARDSFDKLKAERYIRYEDLPLKTAGGNQVEVEFISNTYQIHGRDIIQCNIRDISERMKAQGRDRLVRKILETLNSAEAESDTLHDILRSVQESLDVQAVGIRMQEGDDFPFYVTIGFEEGFLRDECLLCARDEAGDVLRDADGRAWLQCVCGSILQARTDPGLPFFTPGGSFWSNSISELPPSIAQVDSPENMRNSCGKAGYESVALIPLRSKGKITGLLQLNDRRRDRFGVDLIDFLEGLGASIGIALLRKRAESELRFRNLLLSTQQEASIDGIFVVDVNGTIVSHNRHFVDMFGIPREVIDSKSDELTIQSVIDKIEDPDVFLARINEINTTFEASSQEEIALKSGTVFERYSAPLLDAQGKAFGRVWFFRDITARKQAEQVRSDLEAQLRGAQKMEAIGSLAGGVAHDFNNILSVILSNTGFALKATPEGDPRRDDLLEVKKAAERAAGLTRQLLAFSRKQVLQPVPLDLNHVSLGLEKMLRRILGEDIDLILVLAPDIGLTRADPGQIEQVLMNLVVNARDAMPEGGKLTIETAKVDLDSEHAALHEGMEPGTYVMLAVSDSGIGMDEQTKARIFEPFFTTKERGKGTGLGLSTVYGIVNQSGGSIWVYSELGHGTTFKIYFPLDSSAPIAAVIEKAVAIDPPRPVGRATILVVEDEDALRKVAQRSLVGAGYEVMTASNGEEALEIGRRNRGEIDLLLTDVVMPRMGGRLLANEFLKIIPLIKIIFMSGYTDDAIVHHGVLEAGTNFLGKPFTEEALFRKVGEVLGATENKPAGALGSRAQVEDEKPSPAADREAMGALPAGLLTKLRQAVIAARYDEMVELIEVVRGTRPDLAAELRRKADIYDFQGLRDILGQ